jgi:hypothetical protein
LKEKKRVRKTACKREQRQELEEKVKKNAQGSEQSSVERDRSSAFFFLFFFPQFCDLSEVAIIQKKI